MADRRTEEAVNAYLSRLHQAAGCVTDQPILAPGPRLPGQIHQATFVPHSEPARLRSAATRRVVLLDIAIDFAVTATDDARRLPDIHVVSYGYHVLDRDEREILAFHWHPVGFSNVADPHLHLSSRLNRIDTGRDQEPLSLADMHIPTGFVTLEDVVRLLITEFGITPRRDDWDALLQENRMIALAEQSD